MQVQFKVHLSRQFSIAFDLYILIRTAVDVMVTEALCCDSQDWELRNCCPACMYTLLDEPALQFKMLYAMDGNDSLKRVSHTLFTQDGHSESLPRSSELPTGQCVVFDRYYLPRPYVEQFAEKAVSHHPKPEVSGLYEHIQVF